MSLLTFVRAVMILHLRFGELHVAVLYAPVSVKVVRHVTFLNGNVWLGSVYPAFALFAVSPVWFALHGTFPLGTHGYTRTLCA